MSTHHKIDYIEFAGANLEAVKKFYFTIFAWKFTDYGPDYTAFTDGVVSGGFNAEITAGDSDGTMGSPLVILFSDNLEDSKAAVSAAGAKLTKDIYSFPGGRRFHFCDLAGNELAVWSDK